MNWSQRRIFPMIVLVFGAVILAPAPAANAQMSAEASRAYQQGLAAAEQQDWEAAVASFTTAWEQAPSDPHVLYSLGLAHTKAGHDLIGAAWFEAYLQGSPNAANADAVRAEIERQKVVVLKRTEKVAAAVLEAAREIPDPVVRTDRLERLSEAYALIGEIDLSRASENLIERTWSELPADEKNIVMNKLDAHQVEPAARDAILWLNYLAYLANVRDFEQARSVYQRYYDDNRFEAIRDCQMAKILHWVGYKKPADEILSNVESYLPVVSYPGDWIRFYDYTYLSDAYNSIGNATKKGEYANKAESLNARWHITGGCQFGCIEEGDADWSSVADSLSTTDVLLNPGKVLQAAKGADASLDKFQSPSSAEIMQLGGAVFRLGASLVIFRKSEIYNSPSELAKHKASPADISCANLKAILRGDPPCSKY